MGVKQFVNLLSNLLLYALCTEPVQRFETTARTTPSCQGVGNV